MTGVNTTGEGNSRGGVEHDVAERFKMYPNSQGPIQVVRPSVAVESESRERAEVKAELALRSLRVRTARLRAFLEADHHVPPSIIERERELIVEAAM